MNQQFKNPPRNIFRLAICVPTHYGWVADFGVSLFELACYLHKNKIPSYAVYEFGLLVRRGSILPLMRQRLLEAAIDRGATHALMLDTDMTFPRNLVHRLARHRESIVACNCSPRNTQQPNCTAFLKRDGKLIPVAPKGEGLEEVDRAGAAVMLIDLKVLRGMKKPWFIFEYDESLPGKWEGEDFYFCRQLKEAGHKIYIDHGISAEIGHVGQFEYRLEQAQGGE